MKKLVTLTAAAALAAFGLAGPAQADHDFCAGTPPITLTVDTYITGDFTGTHKHPGDCVIMVTAVSLLFDFASIEITGDLTIMGVDGTGDLAGTTAGVEMKYTGLDFGGDLLITTVDGDQKINNSPPATIKVGEDATFRSTGQGDLDINNNEFDVEETLTVESKNGDVNFNNNTGTVDDGAVIGVKSGGAGSCDSNSNAINTTPPDPVAVDVDCSVID